MDSWAECLGVVEDAIAHGKGDKFYRGHGHASWDLLPTLLWKRCARKENELYHAFVTYGRTLLPESNNSWDNLFLMRHCGVPTRLLDWSESFGVALYFALKK